MIQAVLKDADEKQVKNEAVKFWLKELKDVSYDAEDVLDEWITRTLISKMLQHEVNYAPIKEKACSHLFSIFCCFKPVVLRHEIGVKIRELNERLDQIATNKVRYTLTESQNQRESRTLTSSIVDVSDVIGRLDDKEVVVNKILGESSHRDLKVPVISVVGTGGFGKTTLAKLILKEEKVINHFEMQMWVCVSDPFDRELVAKQIIEAAKGNVNDTVSWDALHKRLSESVQGKRFILVLDDVWPHKFEDWNPLKTSLDRGAVGSRIIITTRDQEIATQMDSTFVHRLKQLSDKDSWLMFRRIAFGSIEGDLEILEDIAKVIVRKCKGVPLSIEVLARLLRSKTNIKDWRYVLDSDIWDVQRQGFLPSILFSYYDVPAKLKPCLAYCATLPKDAKIKKKQMVRLWMAQGFLGSDGSKDLELEGERIFDNLAMRSFFQDFEKDSKGNITCCKMHDLVHDFVQFLTESETCTFKDEELKNINVRHLSTLTLDTPSIYKLKKLRTLRPVSVGVYNLNMRKHLGLLHQLECLRVLDLSHSDLQEFPSDVELSLHLRYLNFSHTELKELPETVCNLLNLQMLKLKGCSKLAKLPKGLGKLCNLRHLMIEGTESLKYLPQGLGRLSCLRTLHKFITGDGVEIEGKGCNIRELKLLNHLQGQLHIINLGQVANANGAAEAQLEKKKNLQSLILHFRTEEEEEEEEEKEKEEEEEEKDDDEGILKCLVPHTNLEELEVRYYRGKKLPEWISSLDFNLVKLHLSFLKELLQLPALGKLPFLEVLVLYRLKSVKRIGDEFYGLSSGCGGGGRDPVQQKIVFPKLKELGFNYMDAWKEWDLPYQNGNNNIDFFPNLVELDISECNGLQALPSGLGKLKSLKSLKMGGIGGGGMRGLKSLLGQEILGILGSNDRKGGYAEEEEDKQYREFVKPTTAGVVLFPALTSLVLFGLSELEEEPISEDSRNNITIMPSLIKLELTLCPKLKVVPFYMFSPALKDLWISDCPQLTGLQPGLPPLLEKLSLNYDVGVLSSSLLPLLHTNNNKYPNLHYFFICNSSQSSLPHSFNLLTSIRKLQFLYCKFLDFGPEDFKHLTMLQQLTIMDCPILAKRFRAGSSHSYIISIESTEPDVNVHSHVSCDNCEMHPIVGKRYQCKDCYREQVVTAMGGTGFDLCEECYYTPSKHTDLVNQHRRQGHTFELIENRGDNPVPVHPDDPSGDAEGGLVAVKSAEIEEQNKA
ncbi:hypothetical protein AQUCO_03300047v1 [Aquilegia coerulea]|uniref:ZZ-type domain-containing protein n=1 Tax=Aquilegia coerulea TaxID=218851 RepID=A0A2G5CZA3_AQUCA|nr:hypothetical protein AQUCO_03300047v1 [Aquilegia coerulea]